MELSERERADLANFFSKRFPSFEDRAALCEAVGLAARVQLTGEARAVWSDIVRVAAEESMLVSLAERALRRHPDDENLVELVRVLRDGRGRRGPWLWLGAGGLGAVAVVGLLVWSPWSGAPPAPRPGGEAPLAAPAAVAVAPVPEIEPEIEPRVEPQVEPQVETAPAPPPATPAPPTPPPERPLPAAPEPAAPAPAAAVATPSSGCRGEPGEVIGYWYAGAASPGSQGEVITIEGGVNVRVELPTRENGYNFRSHLVCFLADGWRVRLSRAPVFVTGGAWWVPLAADDVLGR